MTRRPRRNHTPVFKPKVALAAVRGEQTHGERLQDSQKGLGSGISSRQVVGSLKWSMDSHESFWGSEGICAYRHLNGLMDGSKK